MFGKIKSKSPFVVHRVQNAGNPFSISHGSINYSAPRKLVVKPVKISEPKVYRPEISSDEIGGK